MQESHQINLECKETPGTQYSQKHLDKLKYEKKLKFTKITDKVVQFDNIQLIVLDLLRTFQPNWINDQLVNFYINILKSKEFQLASLEYQNIRPKRFWVFSSFFSNTFSFQANKEFLEPNQYHLQQMKQRLDRSLSHLWEKQLKQFTGSELFLIPYHDIDHWLAIAVFGWRDAFD